MQNICTELAFEVRSACLCKVLVFKQKQRNACPIKYRKWDTNFMARGGPLYQKALYFEM